MTATQGPAPQTVGILLFPDVEILDFFGPFHVFSRAALPHCTDGRTRTLALQRDRHRRDGRSDHQPRRPVAGWPRSWAAGATACHAGRPSAPRHRRRPRRSRHVAGAEHPVVLDWIAAQHQAGALTTSVCTGAFLLGAVGLLDGKRATTHWLFTEQLRQRRPGPRS